MLSVLDALVGEDEPKDVEALLTALGNFLTDGICVSCGVGADGFEGHDGDFRCGACSFELLGCEEPVAPFPGIAALRRTSRRAGGADIVVLSDPARAYFGGVGAEPWPATWALLEHVASAEVVAGRCVLELGAGCGALGLWMARHRAARVVLTDLPRLCPLLRANAEVNDLTVAVRALRWGRASDAMQALAAHGSVDLVIGADLCYHEARLAPLMVTLRDLGTPRVLLALPQRSDSVAQAHRAALASGWCWRAVARRSCDPEWLQESLAAHAKKPLDAIEIVELTRVHATVCGIKASVVFETVD